MELAMDLLAKVLEGRRIEVIIPGLDLSAKDLLDSVCFHALYRIREILRDETNSDAECFQKIEEIVTVLEKAGTFCGSRHDFG